MIPSEQQLEQLSQLDGYIMPDNPSDVFWFMESKGTPPSVHLNWVEHYNIPLYFKDYRFMGMSVTRQYPHFLHDMTNKELADV